MNANPSGSEPLTRRSRALILLAIGVLAAAHLLYLSLLITCDLLRIAPRGFVPRFDQGRVTVSDVEPGSIAAAAGLVNGDRIRRANGQPLAGYADWQRVNLQFDPSRPLVLDLERGGLAKTATLRLATGVQYTAPSLGVIVFRAMQLVTLVLGVIVAVKRYLEPSALLGALLLTSLGTVSLVLPTRLGVLWNALPAPLDAVLWIPYAMSATAGPLFFAFATVFPQRLWPRTVVGLAVVPGLIAPAWHLYVGRQLMKPLGSPTGLEDGWSIVFIVNVVYAAGAIGLLVKHWRTASTLTDQRRTAVLILGTALGAASSVGVFAGYWSNPGRGIFTTGPMTVLSLAFLAMPAAFAYAILRHRLFDIRVIVRQGLQYALARRMVDALIPALGALLIVDVVVHRHESLSALLQRRWAWYLIVAAALILVRSQRERWLSRLDRRFFRERYDAERLLKSIADQVRRAPTVEAIEHSIVQQVDEALHPTFVKVLRHLPSSSSFRADSTSPHTSDAGTSLPASLTVIKVLSALGKPLALSLGDTAWVRHQLPLDERTLLLEQGIELLVPIARSAPADLPAGLLLLGPRRSEEPYDADDIHLLTAIADALGALLERSSPEDDGIAECEHCGRCYEGTVQTCAEHAHPLTRTRGTILINGRYRLDARLGRGGMGTVYAATDTVLERAVAVKLIREDLTSPLDLATRFHREARVAAGFSHPHVVRIYDFGVDRVGRPFLVMELLEGETLRERLRALHRLDAREVLDIMRGVCSALKAAHDRGLVHRDLKPENIYLQRHAGGTLPKVLDFGLAKALDAAHDSGDSTAIGTGRGILVGTLDYMSPEQIAGDDVSPAWDLWALGLISHELLTGSHPFRGGMMDTGECLEGVATGKVGSPLPPPAAQFFTRALSPRRADRPQSASAFLDGLEQALS